jgi:hypothetical protein
MEASLPQVEIKTMGARYSFLCFLVFMPVLAELALFILQPAMGVIAQA